MEATIIFHFAGRGDGSQRLSIIDFGQLLDPRWQAPHEFEAPVAVAPKARSFMNKFFGSAYSFVQGGMFWSTDEMFFHSDIHRGVR